MHGSSQNIADYCPTRYGQAVYSARVLIRSQYGYENSYWNDEELCIVGIDYRRANPNGKKETDTGLTNNIIIYPNPASTELNFRFQNSAICVEGSNTKIEILDIIGNSVLKKEFDGFTLTGKINISILANGAYVFKYSWGNTEIHRQSFVVNK